MSTDRTPLVELLDAEEFMTITTAYTWPEGYAPTVTADRAVRGLTGQYVLVRVDVIEPADPDAHEVQLYGWPVKANGSIVTTGAPRRIGNTTIERQLWSQHKGLPPFG